MKKTYVFFCYIRSRFFADIALYIRYHSSLCKDKCLTVVVISKGFLLLFRSSGKHLKLFYHYYLEKFVLHRELASSHNDWVIVHRILFLKNRYLNFFNFRALFNWIY